jgi:hypothetical protein
MIYDSLVAGTDRLDTNITHVADTAQTAGDIMADTNDIQTRLPAALVSGRMDSSTGAMAANVLTAAAINAAALNGKGDWNIGKTGYALTTAEQDAIVDKVWDELKSAHTTADTFGDYLDDEITSRAAVADVPTANAIADQVWDEAIAGHLGAGSTGEKLNAAGAAGDPWSTALPGAYGAGTAGKIVGDNVNATISSRASQTTLDTLDDFVDTEVSAIKAKTDQLTYTNANKVDSSIQAVGDIVAAVANKIADHVLRRTYANVRASSDGDAVSFRSLLGAAAKLVNKWTISGATLTVYHEDDVTSAGTQAVTGTAGADPITTLDTT